MADFITSSVGQHNAIVVGRIVSAQGTTPGPASGITYTIEWTDPGAGVVRLTGQKPAIPRYPGEVDVTAYPAGAFVFGVLSNGQYIAWLFTELLAFAACTQNLSAPSMMQRVLANQLSLIDVLENDSTQQTGEGIIVNRPDGGQGN